MTKLLEGEIAHPSSDGVVFGAGVCRRRLAELLERTGIERAFLITTPSLVGSPHAGTLRAAAGQRLVGEFTESRAQTPKSVVLAALEKVRQARVDGLISFGGSSVVDVTKGVALVLGEGEHLDAFLAGAAGPAASVGPPAARLPHVSLPTTLSGAEYSPYVGITDEAKREKHVYFDKGLAPRWVLLDPEFALDTPDALWAGTGMKLLADCIEEFCSPHSNPYSDALALTALEMVFRDLAPSLASSSEVEVRGRLLFASFMSAMNFSTTRLGLVAALRHPLGARGVPHGVASTIVLPHVLRWNLEWIEEKLARAEARLAPDTAREGSAQAARRFIRTVEDLVRSLQLPSRLRDVNVGRDDLMAIAQHAAHSFAVATNPRPVEDPTQLADILERAW